MIEICLFIRFERRGNVLVNRLMLLIRLDPPICPIPTGAGRPNQSARRHHSLVRLLDTNMFLLEIA